MGQRTMDKPPTKAKPSAFEAEAKALDDRLRELISDYAALFLRYPNVEGRPSVEAFEKMRVLAAIRVHPWRRKLVAQALTLERESLREAGVELRQGADWWEREWIDAIPATVQRREWDVQTVARDLITTMPASLRLRCPGYPGSEDRDAFSAAAVAVATKNGYNLTGGAAAVSDSERCQDSDAIKIGRLALTALGDENARNLRILRPQKD
jgi:hypothetical protein